MIPINTTTVAIQNEADLITAVSDPNINYIYLANDITITDGVTILASIASLVFDGEYPIGTGVRNQFTDVNNSSYDDTLGIRSSSSIALTFRNMIINGRNYYGVPYIVENFPPFIYTDNVTVAYENVRYTGPQMTYNPNGLTRYIDCDITIQQTGASPAQEVGETNRVELGGTTTILHNSLSNDDDFAVFWFRGNTSTMSFTVLEGAQVDINSINCYFMYNMDPLWGTAYPVPYVIRTGGSFHLTVNKGIAYDSRNQLSSFLVDTNATFRYIQTANNGASSSLYLNGALNVQQGAQFYMQAQNGTAPLIQFTSGTNRSLTLDNPLSFVLYRANGAALSSLATTQVSFTSGQLNTWSTPVTPVGDAGGFDDRPEFKWYKLNYASPLVITGTFTQTATSVTGNLATEDLPYPALTDLRLQTARVISLGDWTVITNPVEDDGRPITGWTQPGANVRLIYTIDPLVHTINGAALEDGRFTIETSGETPPNIPAGTEVAIWTNIPFLIKDMRTTSIATGDLMIVSAPDLIVYITNPISTNPVLLPRTDPAVPVVIYDNRVDRSAWELMASITGPLETEFGDTLPDAVVFRESAGAELVTLSAAPVLVRTGGEVPGYTEVSWLVDAGILVRVTAPMRTGVKYTTRVIWELHASSMT